MKKCIQFYFATKSDLFLDFSPWYPAVAIKKVEKDDEDGSLFTLKIGPFSSLSLSGLLSHSGMSSMYVQIRRKGVSE